MNPQALLPLQTHSSGRNLPVRFPRLRASVLIVALALVACGESTDREPPTAFTPAPLAWTACSEPALSGLECARLTVPKVYADPSQGTFALAVVRARATGADAERIGAMLFNPGGPGVSAVDLAPAVVAALPAALRRHFDFVTWDPRGVGRSSGLNGCRDGAYTLPASGPVDWSAVTEQMRSSTRAANQACGALYPDVIPYIGTNATAQDLESLRVAVGDARLTFWGTSYGTRIGYVYAYKYPDRVRAMLLSSPVDPNATWSTFAFGAATSPDQALGFFFEGRPDVKIRHDRVIEALSVQALALPSGGSLRHWDVRGMMAGFMKSESDYATAAGFLELVDAAIGGNGSQREAAIKALDALEWPATYPVNGGATAHIGCLDYAQRLTAGEQDRLAAEIRQQAPIFGFGASQALFFCEGIGAAPDSVPTQFVNLHTPMLVFGSSHDALTQYAWAGEMARNFRNARVVTYLGTQHTSPYLTGSACVDGYATDYLLRAQRPDADVTCPNVHAGR